MEISNDIENVKFRNADIYTLEEENVLALDLYYPKHEQFDTIQLDIVSVRGTDDIRISYDFDRNGWSIKKRFFKQVYTHEVEYWDEVTFIAG